LRIWGSAVLEVEPQKRRDAAGGHETPVRGRVTSARCSRRAASVALRIAPSGRLRKPISRPPDVLIRTGNPSVIESEASRIRRESNRKMNVGPHARLRAPSRAARRGRTSDDRRPPSDRRGPRALDRSRVDEPTRTNPAPRHPCLRSDGTQPRPARSARPSCART
jgi:hypothetical protein